MGALHTDVAIDDRTKVSFGVVIAIAALVLGGLGVVTGWVWWASAVSTRLSSIEDYMRQQVPKATAIDTLEGRVKLVEQFGSEPMRTAMLRLEREIVELKRQLELHDAAAKVKGPQ